MNGIPKQLLVIFGSSGDLTERKLIPSLFQLFSGGYLPAHFGVLGVSRSAGSDEAFRKKVVLDNPHIPETIGNHGKRKEFAKLLHYHSLGDSYDKDYAELKARIEALDQEWSCEGRCIFYLSVPPKIYQTIALRLHQQGLSSEDSGHRRLIVEKPFGYDLRSARELNAGLQEHFREDQIYRIDHYLGKETVQNLLVTRFSNSIFEPLWNRNYIRHVEVTSAESVGVGKRGGYYDTAGALRDMFQNHLLQIVSLVVMEPPIGADAESIRNEKVKALKSLRIMQDPETILKQTIRGQYLAGEIDGKAVPGYREEAGVDPRSTTETYAALKFYVDNWRWADVPFYVRTAKRMPTKVTEVVIHFKTPHHQLFRDSDMGSKENKLIIRIQPNEGILVKFGVKVPGQGFTVERANLDFYYSDLKGARVMDAYERLLLDAMQGDATLYARADEVEAAWEFVDPILDYWTHGKDVVTYGYSAGMWGPSNANDLLEGDSCWRNPGKHLTDDPAFCVIS